MPCLSLEDSQRELPSRDIAPSKSDPPRERLSDSWPDIGTTLSEEDIKLSAEKNKIGRVLGEALGAVVYSVGLVILLMIVLHLFHRG